MKNRCVLLSFYVIIYKITGNKWSGDKQASSEDY